MTNKYKLSHVFTLAAIALFSLVFSTLIFSFMNSSVAHAAGETYTLHEDANGNMYIVGSGGVYNQTVNGSRLFNPRFTQQTDGSFKSQNTIQIGVGIGTPTTATYSATLTIDENQTYGGAVNVTSNCVAGTFNNPCTGFQGPDPVSPFDLNGISLDDALQIVEDNLCPDGSVVDPNTGACPPAANEDDETTSCAIDGVGWLVCPAMTFLGKVNDLAFNFLADSFLKTDIKLIEPNGGTYNAWRVMLSIANICFAIAFIIIVYSQMTGAGISNYGIKKMLPRLVVAAILVNASYLICQLAVDASNVLGYNIKSIFDGATAYITTPEVDLANDITPSDQVKQGFGIAVIVTTLVAAGVGLAFVISIPMLLATLVAFLMIVLILVARTALIVLLIVVAPLAFVAYLLPNTEQWFKKWYKMFSSLLLVFPIIAIVFGASTMAAAIINGGATDADGNDDNMLLQLLAIGVAAVPLFVVPTILRGSMKVAGALGNKLSGWGDKASGRASAAMKKTGKERGANSAFARGRAIRKQAKANYKTRAFAERTGRGGLIGAYTNLMSQGVTGLGITRSQKEQKKAIHRMAENAVLSADAEDLKAEKIGMRKMSNDKAANGGRDADTYLKNEFDKALAEGDSVRARAAFSNLLSLGNSGVEAARSSIEGADPHMSQSLRADLQDHITDQHSDVSSKDNRIMEWASGKNNHIQSTYGGHLGSRTDAQIASQTPESIAASNLSSTDAQRVLNDPNIQKDMKRNQREALEEKAGWRLNGVMTAQHPKHPNYQPPQQTPQQQQQPPVAAPVQPPSPQQAPPVQAPPQQQQQQQQQQQAAPGVPQGNVQQTPSGLYVAQNWSPTPPPASPQTPPQSPPPSNP